MRTLRFCLVLSLTACSREPLARPEENPPPLRPPAPSYDKTALQFAPPSEWKPETPTSEMRKAQWAVPDRDKTERDATCIYFGIMGGEIEQNIDRWKSQFSDVEGEPNVEELTTSGLTITILDISGEYASDRGSEPARDFRMLGAIITTPEGNHFFKFVGPRGTVGDWRDTFVEMLKKARYTGA